MFRLKSSIAEIKPIENYIILNTTHKKQDDSENFSKAFIKQYNIFIQIEGNTDLQLLFSLVPSATVKFWYDYRNYTAEIKIEDFGFNVLCKEFPEFRKMIREIEQHSSVVINSITAYAR